MNDLITIRLTAKNDAKPVLHDFTKQLKQTQNEVKNTGVAAQVMGRNFTGMGRNAGMAGIQVQQLVGQIQAGTNPMLALSQQAADLGFVLGAPMAGAVAGLAASFAMVLLPSLFDTRDAMKEVKDIAEGMGIALREAAPEATIKSVSDYKKAIIETRIEQKKLDRAIPISEGALEFYNEAGEEGASLARQETKNLQELRIELESVLLQRKQFEKKIADITGETERREKAEKALAKAIREQAELEQIVARDLEISYNRKQKRMDEYAEAHRKAQEDMYRAQDEATKAMERNLRPVEDALVDVISGTKSAKEAFKDMARSIISDLIRMQVQRSITAPLAGMLAGFNPFGTSAPVAQTYAAPNYMPPTFGKSSALGGQVSAGQAYTVGEHGRETFIPATNGTIVPDSGAGVTINQTIQVTTGVQQTVRAEIQNLLPQITQATKQAVADSRQRGGGFSKALVGA